MKTIFRALCCAVVISCLLSLTGFCGACEDIEERVFRLHIIANSDSDADQQLKLRVRDRLTRYTEELFSDCETKEEAMKKARVNIDKLRECAQRTVAEQGYCYPVDVFVTKAEFDTRVYEDFTLPAGSYDALRVVIGEGKGHNWWCVLYPAVCVPAAEKNIGSALSEGETDIVTKSDRYAVGFKIVEIFRGLASFFR